MLSWIRNLLRTAYSPFSRTEFDEEENEKHWKQISLMRKGYKCEEDPDFPMTTSDDLSPDEIRAIQNRLLHSSEGSTDLCCSVRSAKQELAILWGGGAQIPVESPFEAYPEHVDFSREFGQEVALRLTPQFRKDVSKVEKKLQGRILVAIGEISDAPKLLRGDTVKPLQGELCGLWRYRIGDYRLIYQPSDDGTSVKLLEFSSRGSAYGA